MNDYFVYLPDRVDSIWGCVARSAGFTRVPPGISYPLQRHPVDHHFTWSQGRILQAYQVIFISEGSGVFETEELVSAVEAGTVLLLFPGVWHRYTPSPGTGWVEHWMEFRGPAFAQAVSSGVIRPQHPVLHTGLAPDVLYCFERCHALTQRGALANHDMLSTLGLHLLAALSNVQRQEQGFEPSADAMVERAQALITLRCQEPLNLPELATELGVSYSRLRHDFKTRIGVSPKQFQLQVRLQKARDLLLNTNKSIKEVADILGFESAFHLSKQFKSRLGDSPTAWREKSLQRRVV